MLYHNILEEQAGMTILEAAGLTKRFGVKIALDRLDLTVEQGEIVCLLGANGAGKTTTINLLLGFLAPDGGRALIGGQDVAVNPRAARAHVAYLPEQVALYPLLTGIENLRYFTSLAGRSLSGRESEGLLVEAGLDAADASKRADSYSKGMRQKVGIAIAMAKGAKAVVLDEPLSGLDPVAANDLGARLRGFRDSGGGVLMVTHDLLRAHAIADRIGIMKAGRLVVMTRPAEVDPQELDSLYTARMSA